jgi:hypothetical protein
MLSFGYKYKSCRHKIVKTANSQEKAVPYVKMLKYLRGGLGGPPIFVACQSISSGDPGCGQWRLFFFFACYNSGL